MNGAWRIVGDPINVLGLVAIIAIWVAAHHQTARDRNKGETALATLAKDMALTVEQTVVDAAQQIDLLLIIFRDQYRKGSGTRHWDTILDSGYTTGNIVIQFTAIDANGYPIASTVNGFAQSRSNLSDREHFKAHANTTDDRLFISKPVLGRASGKLSIQFTRKFFNPDGSFGGVLVASLDPDRLFRMYNTIQLGVGGGIALVGTDDIFRAGTGAFADRIGHAFRVAQTVKMLPVAQVSTWSENVTVETQLFEKDQRVVATRPLARYPLSVMVAVGTGTINDHSFAYASLALVSSLILCVTLGVAAWARRQSSLSLQERNAMQIQQRVAEEAAKDRSRFLAIMSHEIKTPLNGILGVLDIVKDSRLDERSRHCIDIATTSGEALTSLIDDMLLFLQAEDGALQLAQEPFFLTDLCHSIRATAIGSADAAGNTISVEFSCDASIAVLGDGRQLRRVLVNLVDNANKFTKGGTIELRIDALQNDQQHLTTRFRVTDTGIGIPEDKQKDLLNQLGTIDSSYRRRSDGAGLRLALSNRLVKAMGGEIKLDSMEGRGSCFWFDLRFSILSSTIVGLEIARGITPKIEAARPLRILLAEDNATNAFVTSESLTDAGHQVWRAVDGTEAVEQCAARLFDIVLMDISMPKMDGIEAAKIIRSPGALNANTPIMALTAHVFDDSQKEINANLFIKSLSKPIRKKMLLDAITAIHSDRPAEKEKVSSSHAQIRNEVIDLEVLAEFVGARSTDRAIRTISIFVDELEEKVNQLGHAIVARDTHALEMVAHSMLGSGALLGATQLVRLSRATEQHCKTHGTFDAATGEELLSVLRTTILTFSAMRNQTALLGLKQSQSAGSWCRLNKK